MSSPTALANSGFIRPAAAGFVIKNQSPSSRDACAPQPIILSNGAQRRGYNTFHSCEFVSIRLPRRSLGEGGWLEKKKAPGGFSPPGADSLTAYLFEIKPTPGK